jgi:hypothetical protein
MPVVTSGMLHGFQLWINLPAKDKVGGLVAGVWGGVCRRLGGGRAEGARSAALQHAAAAHAALHVGGVADHVTQNMSACCADGQAALPRHPGRPDTGG